MTLMALGIKRKNIVWCGKQLDAKQTGFEAEKLELDLRKRIVDWDEAIEQIVNIYQMNLAGMSRPGEADREFHVPGPDRNRQDAHGGSHHREPRR